MDHSAKAQQRQDGPAELIGACTKRTCLTRGTIIRCCTMSVWQMQAISVKASSLAESLHTRLSSVLVCCFVSSFFRHSSVMYGNDSLPSA